MVVCRGKTVLEVKPDRHDLLIWNGKAKRARGVQCIGQFVDATILTNHRRMVDVPIAVQAGPSGQIIAVMDIDLQRAYAPVQGLVGIAFDTLIGVVGAFLANLIVVKHTHVSDLRMSDAQP
jgi:hypothetical protein